MRLGIRGKLIGTLLLAGLLPLALALGVILIAAIEFRIESKGGMYRALARQQAAHLSSVLASQVEFAEIVNNLPGTVEVLERANAVPATAPEQVARIETAWPNATPDRAPLMPILSNKVAQRWQAVRGQQPRFSEALITDATGRLVAATNKTSDYFQADEEWWKACHNGGAGRALISDVIFDESAISPEGRSGTLVVDLCLPIYRPADAPTTRAATGPATTVPQRRLIGIAKISLDATWIVSQLDQRASIEDLPRAVWLVNEEGRAVLGDRSSAPVQALPARLAKRMRDSPDGWSIEEELGGHEVTAFARVQQSELIAERAERWHVVVAAGREETLSPVYRLVWVILALGLVVIGACFAGGWFVARREILRPLLTLEGAVEQLKAGRRDFRLPDVRGGRATFRNDEIGRLARDFNVMADRLQNNFERLESADALKRQFIDLAGHELRTPVTYILGATQLAERHGGNGDAAGAGGGGESASSNGALGAVIERISSKAQRLNRIVENLFKLLASDQFERAPRVAPVDVAAVVRKVCEDHEPFLRERKQSWALDVDAGLPAIEADPEKVRDIVANLVSNAIRFSPDGATIEIAAAPLASEGVVEIAVTDRGPGIPEADLPNLFQPFFTGGKVDHHTSGEYQYMSRGMGLGLSVVKRFVDLHGGEVRVDTSPRGTTVRVRLPIVSRVTK